MAHSAVFANGEKFYYRASWLQLIRPMTLTGTITPILVGTGIAAMQGAIRFDIFLTMLVASLLIQSATNMFNDYYDFRNGQDQEKWTADASQEHGPSHAIIPYAAGSLLFLSLLLGGWLAYHSSYWVLFVGILSILFGFLYSAGPRPLCSIGLGETVAFIFLGIVVTILAYVVQGNPLNLRIILVSIPFALLIASMILTNNIRDIKKDRNFRRTVPAILGKKRAVQLLTTLLSSIYLTVFLLIGFGVLQPLAIAVVFAFPLAIRLRLAFQSNAADTESRKVMKWAALHHWAFGFLLAIGVWINLLI
ncbi:prenyltransferase [Virgibacillus kekensis]|uniref:Prenyltransferase n=1 Tax=Virgibacillus kekensis TaxID=202261 RepID=A0ABV9DGN8_9BACI